MKPYGLSVSAAAPLLIPSLSVSRQHATMAQDCNELDESRMETVCGGNVCACVCVCALAPVCVRVCVCACAQIRAVIESPERHNEMGLLY